jgi:hypothetical protein
VTVADAALKAQILQQLAGLEYVTVSLILAVEAHAEAMPAEQLGQVLAAASAALLQLRALRATPPAEPSAGG